jgi:hypothetical protein
VRTAIVTETRKSYGLPHDLFVLVRCGYFYKYETEAAVDSAFEYFTALNRNILQLPAHV